MKRLSTPAPLAAAALVLCGATASAVVISMATPIPHRGPIRGKANQLYEELKTGFSGGRYGPYQVVERDPKERRLVVKRNAIDVESWSKWAYCRVDPIDMLYSLRDGKVTLTIKLEPTTKTLTYAVVWAQFEGSYGIGTVTKNFPCTSTGVLEEDILHRIGSTTP
jgi:hypothetical protein